MLQKVLETLGSTGTVTFATDWRNKSLNCDDKELTDNLLLTCTLQIKIELDLHWQISCFDV